MSGFGRPRRHYRLTTSTNDAARELAASGAPHGTLVTADEQSAGRGRQGRRWSAPAGQAILMSLVLRGFDGILPLRAGLAVADLAGPRARVKWPNDVLVDERKVAGILVEARPQEGSAVLGIGVNVAVDVTAMPEDLRATAGSLGRTQDDVEPALQALLGHLDRRLGEPAGAVLAALRPLDALRGRLVRWDGGEGTGAGLDDRGALLVTRTDGTAVALDAGEVHLLR
jgi:BirA family biotin operon repressor/biotin-[acetyl-CoA-carboxylase] ligase